MKKNIAIVGYGGQGAWHASHAQKSDVVSLAGIFDISEKRVLAAKEAGITTAMETTAFADREVIARFLPYLDTVLMDIKHMNGAKHKEFTTRDNATILENARYIAESGVRLIIRTPVIPTFNDTEEEIGAIAKYAASIGVKEHHLLPYHRIGTDKYKGLDREYTLSHIMPPDGEKMQRLLSVVISLGLKGQIGG